VIGSRYVHGVSVVNWPLRRIVLSAFANRYIRAITGLSRARLHERVPVLAARARSPRCRSSAFVSDGYAFLVETLFEAARAGAADRRGADHLRRAPQGVSKLSRRVLLESMLMPGPGAARWAR
jgi:dolichol-phosphate mannosyltransferase